MSKISSTGPVVRSPLFVADNNALITLVGLRWVSKTTTSYTPRYKLEVAYKGQTLTIAYDTEHERDAMFDRLLDSLRVEIVPEAAYDEE